MKTVTKIDRLKLSGSPERAENLFNDVYNKTGVALQWEPSKICDGQKKEAVIKLCGSPEGVKIAREMILECLEIESNRVVMKMDITHEEHPSLIGKKGVVNKHVMALTNCFIHYPDINLKTATIKSNQVSITGEPCNVEKARIMLRALMPFQVTFDVDLADGQFVNTAFPLWKKIEDNLGLNIHFIRHKNGISVTLRCSQELFSAIRHQMLALIELLSQKRGSDLPPVKVVMDIMPQNHGFVKGPRGSNIQAIANRTGAKIVLSNLNSEVGGRCNVIITGNLDCVYMAWQEVMNCLPVTVSFDVNETRETNNGYSDFLHDCNVSVNTKAKQEYIKGVFVKGPEKFLKQILQYRQRVLNLAPIKFQPDISYAKIAFAIQSSNDDVPHAQILQNLNSISNNYPVNNSDFKEVINFLNMRHCFQNIENVFLQGFVPYNAASYPSVPYVNTSAGNDRLYGRNRSHQNQQSQSTVLPVSGISDCSTSLLWGQNSININEAVIEDSNQSHEQSNSSFSTTENRHTDSPSRDPLIDPFEKRLSAYQAIHRQIESPQVPSSLWSGYGFSQSMPAAFTARERDLLNLYSSNSLQCSNNPSPNDSLNSLIFADYFDDSVWTTQGDNAFSMSNVFDFKTNTSLPKKFNHKDILPELLYKEGLYNYIDVFLRQEIDYTTFLHLSESDLINLGINYQGRMKITCLIRELQERNLKTFDAAPGAGRKTTDTPKECVQESEI